MSEFLWKEEYSVGIPSIDKQHQGFVALMDIDINATPESLQTPFVDKLANYAKEHFTYEEDLFQKYAYPDEATHKQEHEQFILRVAAFRTRINQGNKIPLFDFYQFYTDWLVKHIAGEDKKYSDFLISKGVH